MKKLYGSTRRHIWRIVQQSRQKIKTSSWWRLIRERFSLENLKRLCQSVSQCCIAEQNAAALRRISTDEEKSFLFGISNFVTLRCFEQIKMMFAVMTSSNNHRHGTGYVIRRTAHPSYDRYHFLNPNVARHDCLVTSIMPQLRPACSLPTPTTADIPLCR